MAREHSIRVGARAGTGSGRYHALPVFRQTMAGIHITDIEAAINYWREKKPSPDGVTLAPELRALAEVYALMIFYHEDEAA